MRLQVNYSSFTYSTGCQDGPYVAPTPEFSTLAVVFMVLAGAGVMFVVVGTSLFAYNLLQQRRDKFLPVYHGLHNDIALSLCWENISCSIAGRQILSNISGVALPGHVTAILGPSGN